MSTRKIGLITTLQTNLGDDLIRKGICRVLAEAFEGERLEFLPINKHVPLSVYPAWHPIQLSRLSRWLPRGKRLWSAAMESAFHRIGLSRFDRCNLIVQCGAPVFYPKCSRSEWAVALWRNVVGRLRETVPALNLAAGSCYAWKRQDEPFQINEDHDFIRSILGYCRLTTVRDRLAGEICAFLGSNPPRLPCTAFLAMPGPRAELRESGYLLINYMHGGGHYEWQQQINPQRWKQTILSYIERVGRRHKVAFLCHDQKEFLEAREMAGSATVFFPTSLNEYFEMVREAKFGIFNRMHACVGVAGLGIPSIGVCTDTRMLMVSELGLKTHFVSETTAEELEEETEAGLSLRRSEQERLLDLRSRTLQEYVLSIRKACAKS